jgi:hypothetical protein
VVTPAPGLHRGRGDWVRIEPRTGINSHRVRIEPETGHQQSSVLTTELRCTPKSQEKRASERTEDRRGQNRGLERFRGQERTEVRRGPRSGEDKGQERTEVRRGEAEILGIKYRY